jgi:amino acid adenylation domain-containing protein/non-ribosomal peptide synthase protein (TIGR01720 family)
VMVTRENLAQATLSRLNYYRSDFSGLILLQPFSFDVATGNIFWTLCAGATLFLEPRSVAQDPQRLLDCLVRTRSSHLVLLPLLYAPLLDLATPEQLQALRTVIVGGEQMPLPLVQKHKEIVPQADLFNEYGPTETTIMCCAYACDAHDSVQPIPIGRPMSPSKMYLLDHAHHPVPSGLPGEICIGGPQVSLGYLGRPALTAEHFLPDPFAEQPGARMYCSGDLGKINLQGNIEFLGRQDHQVKIRGFRVELGEIEAILRTHPDVAELAVVAVQQGSSKRLIAYLVPHIIHQVSDQNNLRATLTQFAQSSLPEYMVPSAFVLMQALPLTANGKLDQKALPAPDATTPATTFTAAGNEIEEKLCKIWGDVLGIKQVGIHDNFFMLGGDSILSIQIVSRANQLGLGLSVKQLFQHQTIAKLSGLMGQGNNRSIDQGPLSGPFLLGPVQHWFLDQHPPEPHHFNQSLLLNIQTGLTQDILFKAFSAIARHHDMLRARFIQDAKGWQAHIDPIEECTASIHHVDLRDLPLEHRSTAMIEHAREAQASLDLATGPISVAIRYRLSDEGPDKLLWIIHHLSVDGISWRILLEDLELALEQGHAQREISFHSKTDSFPAWTRRLADYSASSECEAELNYWKTIVSTTVPSLPVDTVAVVDPRLNTKSSAQTLTKVLPATLSEALLLKVPSTFKTQINDVLLAALMMALNRWTGQGSARITLEGHGREELFEDVDISRTVGWFTSGFPVVLTRAPGNSHIDNILHTKTLLQSIPKKGVGFGILSYLHPDQSVRQSLHSGHEAQLSFNYLGQFKESQASTWILGEALEPTDQEHSPLGLRKPLIEINALHRRDQLEVNWTFSINLHHTQTIDVLAEHFMNVLSEIVALCDVGPDNLQDLYPLSPMQQGMLFHSQLGQEPGAYTIQLSSRMQGDFSPSVFMKAWQEVLNRHPSLRAVIITPPGLDPLQGIVSEAKLPWFDFDWRDLSPEAQHEQWLALLETDRIKGFDAETCPLMRCTLVQTEDHSWRFLWSHHHLLTDGWCLPILMREVLECYESFAFGRPYDAPLPPLYREYIEWLQSKDLNQAKSFWREYLKDFDTPTSLGVDQKGLLANTSNTSNATNVSSDTEPRYGSHTIALDTLTTHSLTQLARTQGLTLSVLIQSAWSVLLSRYSGSHDVVFGATVSGRPAELVGVEQMIGLFINTLPVRTRIDTSESLLAFFSRMRDDQLSRDEYAFTPLVDIHACTDIPKRHALFESIVIFENYPVDSALDAQAQALRIDEVEVHEQTGFPLTLTAAPGERIPLKLSWESSRFETEQAVRLLEHLTNLLTRLATALPSTVAQWSASMMGADEVEQLCKQFNHTTYESPDHQRTLFELFERQAQKCPSSIAVICADEKISYAELYARSLKIGASLREQGAMPGVRIGIYQHRTINMVATLLAIQSTGAAYVPLDPGYPSERIQYMLDDCDALLIVSEDALLDTLPSTEAIILSVQALVIGPENQSSGDITDRQTGTYRTKMQDLAYMIYTSGSTGRPKGVPISQANLTNFLLSMQRTPGMTDHDVLLAVTTISFDIAGLELYLPLITGARIVLASREDAVDASKLSTLIHDHGVTVLQATPTTWRMLLETEHSIASLNKGFCGGEGVPQELAQSMVVRGIEVWNLYGPTETTIWSCAKNIKAHSITAPYEDIGHPIDNTQIYIVDRDLNLMPLGAPGELLIGGAGLSPGYWHRPDLTADKFVPNPFGTDTSALLYRTGDLAYQRADGSLVCLGRIDHQIKIRGFRVEPGEIEALIEQHDAVKQALVTIWSPRPDDKRLVAYVITHENESTTEMLKEWLRSQLPAYMIPTEWVTLESFPLTPNGKLDRQALPEPGRELHDAYVEPSTHTEALLAELMSQTLQISRISATDDFFDLGGHSLLAGRFVAAVSNKLSVQLPLSTIFEKSSVRALSEHIDSLLWAAKQMSPRSEALSDDEEEFRL